MPLTDLDRDRLAKLLAMASSDFDGEVATAARMANALVKNAGLTWRDLIAAPQQAQQQPRQQPRRSWHDVVLDCQPFIDFMSAWEATFLWSIASQGKPLTDRQSRTLRAIAKKLGVAWVTT